MAERGCAGALQQGKSFPAFTRLQAALKCYDKAIQLDATFHAAYMNRGFTKDDVGDYLGAIDYHESNYNSSADNITFPCL